MGFTLGGLGMLAKEPMVDGIRTEFNRLALVAAAI